VCGSCCCEGRGSHRYVATVQQSVLDRSRLPCAELHEQEHGASAPFTWSRDHHHDYISEQMQHNYSKTERTHLTYARNFNKSIYQAVEKRRLRSPCEHTRNELQTPHRSNLYFPCCRCGSSQLLASALLSQKQLDSTLSEALQQRILSDFFVAHEVHATRLNSLKPGL